MNDLHFLCHSKCQQRESHEDGGQNSEIIGRGIIMTKWHSCYVLVRIAINTMLQAVTLASS